VSSQSTPADAGAGAITGDVSRVRIRVVVIAFLAVLIDGFDGANLAFLVPTLASSWEMAPSSFTTPLVLTNVGAVIGFVASGAFGARIGRRRLMILAVTVFASASILTALVLDTRSIPALSLLRLITGVGLGLLLPAAISLASDHSPSRRREVVAIVVTLGLAMGALLGGMFGRSMIESIGPSGVFWVAGVLPVLLIPAIFGVLSEPPQSPSMAAAKAGAHVSRLFVEGLRLSTLLLWAFAFLVFVTHFTLQAWTPTLLLEYGFVPSETPIGAAVFNTGGILGGIVLIGLTSRIGAARSIALMSVIGLAFLLAVAKLDLDDTMLLVAIGGAGAGIGAGLIGQLTVAVSLYSGATRTTGVGWAAALGRAGSVIGPAIAGLLLSLALPARDVILTTTAPIVLAVVAAVLLARRLRARSDTEQV
jgi:MFS transporter, AAHS family, 4-hydroxybenzoate transporter